MLTFVFLQSFCKQLLTGNKISLASAVPSRPLGPVHSQRVMPPRQAPGPALRQPLVGIDVQALHQAQKALKPPHASGNDKYMTWNTNEQNKVLRRLRVVSNFGNGDSGESEIHSRAHVFR